MNICIKNLSPVATLITALILIPFDQATAQVQWASRIASTINWPGGIPNIGLAIDTNDNCYAAGFFDDTNNFGGITLTNQSIGGDDIFVAKYNSAGALQWVQQAGGTTINTGRAIGVDTNGNIYVTGGYGGAAKFGSFTLPSASGQEFYLAKYNSTGAVQWVQVCTNGSSSVDGLGLTVDGAGNSYALVCVDYLGSPATVTFGSITVNIPANSGTTLMILVKYDTTGTAKWAQLFNSSQETYATKLAVDAAGNVYVRGLLEADMTIGNSNLVVSPASDSENLFIAKFNNSGALTWVQQPQGGNSGEGGVAVDPAGNVYVSGYFDTNLVFGSGITLTNMANPTSLFGDAFVAKYNSAGAIQWARAAGGTNGGFYWDVGLDAQTNIYAGGFVGYNAAVAKYNLAGTLQWTVSASGTPASPVSSGFGNCVADSTGNCFLGGFYQGTNTFGSNALTPQEAFNFFLTKLSSSSALTVATTSLPNGTEGVAYNQTLMASGGQTPYIWTNTSGGLPPGLSLASNGVISGTPTSIVSTNFTVKVKDTTNGIATQLLSLTIQAPAALQINTTSLQNGTNGVAYNQTLVATGGQPPYSWMSISGTLPTGLTLATNGVISGAPTTNGTFNFTAKVTDSLSSNATQALTLTLGSPPSVMHQPTNISVTVSVGSNVSLGVSVTGTGPFSYQWQLNGTNLPNGIITTMAGNGTNGYSGDGSAATNSELYNPASSAVDANGNLFIADTYNDVIRKVGTNGIITTVVGNGTNGYSGDGGAATNAELYNPFDVAVNATGNLFIADYQNNRIREVEANGIITTIAGNGTGGYFGDGGAATNAELNSPIGVAVDATGNLFIADQGNSIIRKVGTNGIITTVAGNGTQSYSGDGGMATNAELYLPDDVAVDATGNLFIADAGNNRIRKVGTNGIITTVAGNGTAGHIGDGGAATNAELSLPTGVAVNATGYLFIADYQNNRIREVEANGFIIAIAGNGTNGYSGDGGAATNAELNNPARVAVDAAGNLFITDFENNVIRKVAMGDATLALNDVSFRNAGAYDVVVSSPYGSVTSSVVNVTVTLPALILSTPQISVGSTNFTFLLSGPAGSNYVIQISTNLSSWSPVSTSSIPIGGSINLTNAINGNKQQFYRALIP